MHHKYSEVVVVTDGVLLTSSPTPLKHKHPFSAVKMNSGWVFPGGAVVENLPANAGNMGSSPGLGRSHMPRSN